MQDLDHDRATTRLPTSHLGSLVLLGSVNGGVAGAGRCVPRPPRIGHAMDALHDLDKPRPVARQQMRPSGANLADGCATVRRCPNRSAHPSREPTGHADALRALHFALKPGTNHDNPAVVAPTMKSANAAAQKAWHAAMQPHYEGLMRKILGTTYLKRKHCCALLRTAH